MPVRAKDGRTVDMSRFVVKHLVNEDLQEQDYIGVIVRVVPQKVFNKWKFTKDEVVPVVEFGDGVSWIPNQRCRKVLIDSLGKDTDAWVGQRLRVFLKAVVRTEAVSGRGVEKIEKFVEVLDDADEEPAW